MFKPQGYSVVYSPGERNIEHDTISCAHCGAITFVRPSLGAPLQVVVMRDDGTHYLREVHKCFRCDEYICPRCVGKECEPKLKRIEREELEARKLIWY